MRHVWSSLSVAVLSLAAFPTVAWGATWEVSPSGSDAGTGHAASPWRSLAHACASVTHAGDTIHLAKGEYPEGNTSCHLAVGVSILGEGNETHVVSTLHTADNFLDGAIVLHSDEEGTDGHQSLSHFSLDGSAHAADNAIVVHGRGNVSVNHLEIVAFYANAVQFDGRVGKWGQPPAKYAAKNELAFSRIDDCATRNGQERGLSIGLVAMSGQDGLSIHDNDLRSTSRPPGQNGDIVEAIEGNNKNLHYFRNISHKPDTEGDQWDFHIEHWTSTGGMEIDHNEFHGGVGIDVGGAGGTRGTAKYSWSIHDNLFALAAQIPDYQDKTISGIDFEGTVEDAYVTDNHFLNVTSGVIFALKYLSTTTHDVHISRNLFENVGYGNGKLAFGIMTDVSETQMTLQDIFIDNNTFVTAPGAGRARGALVLAGSGTMERIYLRNNIIEDTALYGYLAFWDVGSGSQTLGTIRDVYSENNVLFGNENGTDAYYRNGQTVTNFVVQDNLTVDPQFAPDSGYHLAPGSPAIDAGTKDVDLPYAGKAPDIGAFETGLDAGDAGSDGGSSSAGSGGGAGTGGSGGAPPGAGGGGGTGGGAAPPSSGCGCAIDGRAPTGPLALLALAAMALAGRTKRR